MSEQKEQHVTVQRRPSERFVLKSDNPHWWANIIISPDGFLDIQSDYGSYSYCWGSFGDDFKAFLTGCDNSYLLRKFGKERTEFDAEKTVSAIKKDIIKVRQDRYIDAEEARALWDSIWDFCSEPTLETFAAELMHTDLFQEIYSSDPTAIPIAREADPSACAFLEKIWPHFITELKKPTDDQIPQTVGHNIGEQAKP